MLRTRPCDLFGIDVPIILAEMGAGATLAEFAAAVSNEGGLGSVGCAGPSCAEGAANLQLRDQKEYANRSIAPLMVHRNVIAKR